MGLLPRAIAIAVFATLMAALLAAGAGAMQLQTGQSATEMVGGSQVSVTFIGLNTQESPGTAFFTINGQTYMLHNGTARDIGGLHVVLSHIDYWQNLSGGTAYLTFVRAGTCNDGVQDQGESDVDCGGPCGPTCNPGRKCASSQDCASGMCQNFICVPQRQTGTCFDGIQDQGEGGVDCGGPCAKSCVISVRNLTTICGEGCFFLNGECSCPPGANASKKPNPAQQQNETAAEAPGPSPAAQAALAERMRIAQAEEVVRSTYAINVSSTAYNNATQRILVQGTRQGRLLGLIPISVPFSAVAYAQNGTIAQTQMPHWAFLVLFP